MDFNGIILLELNNAEFIDNRFKRSLKASKLFYEIINYYIMFVLIKLCNDVIIIREKMFRFVI